VTLQVGLRTHAQDHDWHNLVTGLTLIVLNRGHDLPDDAVAIAAGMNGEAAFPFPLQGVSEVWRQGVSEVWRVLQLIEQAPIALDLPMSLRIVPFQPAKIVPGFRR